MATLESLPVGILRIIVQHLETPTTTSLVPFDTRKDTLSLATVCKRLRRIIFDGLWIRTHRMEFTYEKIKKTKEVLQPSQRKKVESLVLYASCDVKAVRPTLVNYIEIFPNLASVYIDFVYPHGRPHKPREPPQVTNQALKHSTSTAGRSLRSVFVSITKDLSWSGTSQERFVAKVMPHVKASMKAIATDTLDRYALEIATSRSKEDRDAPTYWKELEKRIKSACAMPARDIALAIGEIRVNGEVARFLDMLGAAIKGWPKGVEKISIQVLSDDFIMDSKNKDKFNIDKKGRVSLAKGWIPTKEMMTDLTDALKKDRPNFRSFRLVVMVRSSAFSMVLCKPIFEFSYAKREIPNSKPAKISSALGTKDQPIDVEDFAASSAVKQKRSMEPECQLALIQSVVQELYDAMKDCEEDSEMGGDGFDSYDELEEEIAMMQERPDQDGISDEDDDMLGLGGRPRWAAY